MPVREDEPAPEPRSLPLSDVLAGAVAQRCSTRGPRLARAKHGGVSAQQLGKSRISDWESAIGKIVANPGDAAAVAKGAKAADKLRQRDEQDLIDLFFHKLAKHATAHRSTAQAYTESLGDELRLKALERALGTGNTHATQWLAGDLETGFGSDRDRVAAIVVNNAINFLQDALPQLKKSNQGFVVKLLQEPGVLDGLRTAAADEADDVIRATPMLRAVVRACATAGDNAGQRALVNAFFTELIEGEYLNLGYSATALGSTLNVLLGTTSQMAPGVQGLDCHHLLYVFEQLLKAHPKTRKATFGFGQIRDPLLTNRLSTLPGGLIAKTFRGNVFDDAGKRTGQIFFSGGAGTDAHTWAVVGGRAYDPLFGTTGSAVANSVAARFDRTTADGAFKEKGKSGGKARFMIKDATLKVPDNPYGFSTGYRLTTTPARYGVSADTPLESNVLAELEAAWK